ncbi:hypothetical protein Sjap_011479 [Stephania japonica]|uniref:Uncharacterized protein n=1 Tax=Stephania japonica TaxID=461633 RepID=A0AAP0JB68_9MAGN
MGGRAEFQTGNYVVPSGERSPPLREVRCTFWASVPEEQERVPHTMKRAPPPVHKKIGVLSDAVGQSSNGTIYAD